MTHYQQQLSMYGRPVASPRFATNRRFATSPMPWSRRSTIRAIKLVAGAVVELALVVGLVAVSLGLGSTRHAPGSSPMPAAPVVVAPAAPAPAPAPLPAPAPAPQP